MEEIDTEIDTEIWEVVGNTIDNPELLREEEQTCRGKMDESI